MIMSTYFLKVIVRNVLKLLWLLPISKSKIFFISFNGIQISDSPLYIYRRLKESNIKYNYVWCYTEKKKDNNTIYVKLNSFSFFIQIITSKYIITNNGLPAYIPYRRNQIIIDTFHGGGAYKNFNMADKSINTDKTLYKSLRYYEKHLSYFVSSNAKFTELVKIADLIPEEKILPIGMPRNDIFFNKEYINDIYFRVRNSLKIPDKSFVVLYAPTYRGFAKDSRFTFDLDINSLRKIIEEKYQKKAFLIFRGHHSFKEGKIYDQFDYDASGYHDMQELLCCSDFLITDYSSSIWDYSFLDKPVCLYASDIDDFIETRGFYTDPYSWHFKIAKNNEELIEIIKNFDLQEHIKNMNQHHCDLGSYEDGSATDKICDLIIHM